MKSLTVRLPDSLIAEIQQESHTRRISKSDVVRERLRQNHQLGKASSMRELIGDLVGSVQGLPTDLSSRKRNYLPGLIRGEKLHRR